MTVAQALSLHPDAILFLPLRKGETKRGYEPDKAWVFAHPEYQLTKSEESKFKKLIAKRRAHWPVAYLTGHKEFFGFDFLVTPDTLIPRPETELLVELALQKIKNSSQPPLWKRGGATPSLLQREGRGEFHVIDIGTGSGNIIISLAKSLSPSSPGKGRNQRRGRINLFATDSSAKALAVARSNARRHGVSRKIKFLRGNLLSPLKSAILNLQSTIILANLPYLTPRQYRSNPDLAREPRSALVAGEGGLKYHRELFKQTRALFPSSPGEGRMPAGQERSLTLLLEHDPAQVGKLKKLAKDMLPGKPKISFHRDLAQRWRVMEINLL